MILIRRFVSYSRLAPVLRAYRFSSDPNNNNNNNRPKPRLSPQELKKAHDQISKEMLSTEDQSSYENQNINKNHILAGGLLAVGIATLLSYLQTRAVNNNTKKIETEINPGQQLAKEETQVKLGGDWTLLDVNGNDVSSTDLLGSYYVIYFGFCRCPDLCPTYLYKISQAFDILRKSSEARYFTLRNIFVSLDPDNDTPEKMQAFLSNFDKSIVGLTGLYNDDPALLNAMSSYKIFRNKVYTNQNAEKLGKYLIDHTTLAFLMSDDNRLLTILGPNLNGRQMAKLIADKIMDRENNKMKAMKKNSEKAAKNINEQAK